jgi:hypothetical protein
MASSDDTTDPARKRRTARPPVTIDLPSQPVTSGAGAPTDAASGAAGPLGAADPTLEPVPSGATDAHPGWVDGEPQSAPGSDPISTAAPSAAATDEAAAPGAETHAEAVDGDSAASGPSVAPAAPVPPTTRSSGFGAGVLGGIAAALVLGVAAFVVMRSGMLTGHQGGLGQRVTALETSVGTAASAEALGQLRQEVGGLSDRLDTIAADRPADMGPRIDELQGTVAALAQKPGPDLSGIEAELESLSGRISGLDGQLGTLAATAEGLTKDMSGLPDRVAALEEGSKSIASAVEALTGEIATLQTAIAEARRPGPEVVGFAASNLRAALDAGRPYAAELAILAAGKVDPARIAALQPFAETGAPSGPALAERFRGIAAAWTPDAPGSEAGFLDSLVTNARRLVTIRSRDAIEGSGPEAVASRLYTALEANRFDEALGLWRELPKTAQDEAAPFGETLAARAAAEAAAADVGTTAAAAIAAPEATK